jgi:hypothetical protein
MESAMAKAALQAGAHIVLNSFCVLFVIVCIVQQLQVWRIPQVVPRAIEVSTHVMFHEGQALSAYGLRNGFVFLFHCVFA